MWALFLFAFARPVGATPCHAGGFHSSFHPVFIGGHGGGGGGREDGCMPDAVGAADVPPPVLKRIALSDTDVVEVDGAGDVLAIRHASEPPTWTRFAPHTAHTVDGSAEVIVDGDVPPVSAE